MERPGTQAVSGRSQPRAGLVADYRDHAAELRDVAALGGDDVLDQELLLLAQQYDLLAEMVEERLNLPTEGACSPTPVA
jgi:hypothetical protein